MSSSSPTSTEAVHETVRARYAEQALRVANASGSCCAPSCCGGTGAIDPITSDLYTQDEAAAASHDDTPTVSVSIEHRHRSVVQSS